VFADNTLGISQNDVFQSPPGMPPIPNCRDVAEQSTSDGYYWENEW
jgi:hypothetical protein